MKSRRTAIIVNDRGEVFSARRKCVVIDEVEESSRWYEYWCSPAHGFCPGYEPFVFDSAAQARAVAKKLYQPVAVVF